MNQACKRFLIPEARDTSQGTGLLLGVAACFPQANGMRLLLDISVFVEASALRWAQPICLPALSKPQDLFYKLGPAHFFNASCQLHQRRFAVFVSA